MNLQNKKCFWSGWVVTVLATLPFIPSAAMKFAMHPKVTEGMAHFGFQPGIIITLGILEALCIVLYLIPKTTVLGAILFTGYLGGAICTHLRLNENVLMHAMIGVAVWAGVWLRDERLQKLIPFRKN